MAVDAFVTARNVPSHPPASPASTARTGTNVTTEHWDVLQHRDDWLKIDHVLQGASTIRANARAYVPESADHIKYPKTYEEMIKRTLFVNYTARCVDSIEGLIFRKDPEVYLPYRLKPRLENINHAGDHINTFSKKLVRNVVSYGRAVIVVDAIPGDKQDFSKPLTKLPYLTLYTTFSVTNWRQSEIDGHFVPDQVVLREAYNEREEFGSTPRTRYRVLSIDTQGRYRVQLYDQRENTNEYYISLDYNPTKATIPYPVYFTEIPIVFINPVDLSMDVHKSPILDLVDANLHLLYLESEYITALHLTATPTPVISGWRDETPNKVELGPQRVLFIPENSKAEMLEFHGHALEPLENAIASTREYISELGARLGQNRASGPETAEAARIRQTAMTGVVSSIARTCSEGLKKGFDYLCDWAVADKKEATFKLNQDYLDIQPQPQMIMSMLNLYREGLFTTEHFGYWLVTNELLPPGKTVEQYIGDLESGKPIYLGVADTAVSARSQQRAADPANGPATAPTANGTATPQQNQRQRQRQQQRP